MEQSNKRNTYITVAVLIALVLIVAGAMAFARQGSDDSAESSQSTNSQATQPAETKNESATESPAGTTAETGNYKNGTYTATGGYSTPGGRESVNVSLTVKDGVVTESTAAGSSADGRAARYQRDFEANYKQFVVGKKLEDIYLSRVSGSSLTSQGFNDALTQIAEQAKA